MTNMKPIVFCLIAALLAVHATTADDLPEIPPPSDDAAVWYLTAYMEVENALLTFEDPDQARNLARPWEPGRQHNGKEPTLEQIKPVIERLDDELDWARQGSTLERCVWPVELIQTGPYQLLPHLAPMRTLARMLATSAMLKRAGGDLAGSTEDCLAILRMARHAAADHILISVLVQYSIEGLGIDGLITGLDQYDRAGLEALRDSLDGLPPKVTMYEGLATERAVAIWLHNRYEEGGADAIMQELNPPDQEQPGDGVDADTGDADATLTERQIEDMLDGLDQAYEQLLHLHRLPIDRFLEAQPAFEKEVEDSANPFIRIFLPALGAVRRTESRALSRRAMLDAMIAYRLDGEAAFQAVLDPATGEPFNRELTDEGVVVSSPAEWLERDGQPWSLTFPAGCAQPLE